MYTKITCRIHDKEEIEKHYSGRFGAPGMKREKRCRKTPEEMARQNHWRRCRELRRIIELNFREGDWHCTLTCRKDARPDKEQAKKLIRIFRDKLRKEYKKRGWELKYVISCETGERGAVHWHVIINNMHDHLTNTARIINKVWKTGRTNFVPLDGTGDYKKLAEYIVKSATKRIENEETVERLSYMSSRNLIRPVVQKVEVRAASWKKQPKIPEGWELVPDSLVNGINKFTGLPYQHYTIRRKEVRHYADSGYLHRHRHKGT